MLVIYLIKKLLLLSFTWNTCHAIAKLWLRWWTPCSNSFKVLIISLALGETEYAEMKSVTFCSTLRYKKWNKSLDFLSIKKWTSNGSCAQDEEGCPQKYHFSSLQFHTSQSGSKIRCDDPPMWYTRAVFNLTSN